MKKVLSICFVLINAIHGYGQKQDTFRVYFLLDDARVSKKASKFIDSLVIKKILAHGEKLTVLGYADYLGSNGYNDTLSYTRARNVADNLIKAGVGKEDIRLCVGKGKIERAPVNGRKGYADDRNVQIIRGWAKATKRHGKDTTHIIDVSKIQVNVAYPLNILFENARSTILEESMPEMQKLFNFLNNNKTITVQIEGHICCMDPRDGTMDGYDFNNGGKLSVNRAKVIYEYLIAHGIDKKRLNYIGLANTRPWKIPEKTEDDKKQNRRVEIRVMSK